MYLLGRFNCYFAKLTRFFISFTQSCSFLSQYFDTPKKGSRPMKCMSTAGLASSFALSISFCVCVFWNPRQRYLIFYGQLRHIRPTFPDQFRFKAMSHSSFQSGLAIGAYMYIDVCTPQGLLQVYPDVKFFGVYFLLRNCGRCSQGSWEVAVLLMNAKPYHFSGFGSSVFQTFSKLSCFQTY